MIPPRTVLVAIDFSDSSRRALALAARLAHTSSAALHVLHAEDPLLAAAAGIRGFDLRKETTAELEAFMAGRAVDPDAGNGAARSPLGGVRPTIHVVTGAAADVVCDIAVRERADVVVMGGGFLPGIGGHNPMEPARIGRPILTGPHVFNAAEAYADLFAEAAAIEAADAPALGRHLRGLLDNPAIVRRMGEAARAYADRREAALDEAFHLLTPLLPA